MSTSSTEQRELQLIENVEFKILGVASDEKKLQQLLQRFLAPVILKAASEHASVRVKVLQLVTRLKIFIQPPEIVLPISALLDQYKTNASGLVKQLDLTFIQHSIERLDEHDRRTLIPAALRDLAEDESQPRAATMINVVLRLILDLKIPPRGSKDDETFRDSIGLSENRDAQYLANVLGIFLRLRVPNTKQTWETANPSLSSSEVSLFSSTDVEQNKIFQRMSELKLKIVTFLASAAFTDDEKFMPALYASSSFDNKVASAAEDIMKRTSVSTEDEGLIERLFEAHSKLPAAYRIRILGLLSKSAISASMTAHIMNIVGLDFRPGAEVSNSNLTMAPASSLERTKLHKVLFQYISWVARIGPSRPAFTIGPQLIASMRSYVEDQGWPVALQTSHDDIVLRSAAYETIGMLSRGANLPVAEKLDLASWLFRSLSEDTANEAVINIDGALSSLTANFPVALGSDEGTLRNMLLKFMYLKDEAPAIRSTRHAVVKWANQCLPFSDIWARWIDILASGSEYGERNEVIEQGRKGLDPWTYLALSNSHVAMPDWQEMMLAYFDSPIESITTSEPAPTQPIFRNFNVSKIAAIAIALRYCKQMLFLSGLKDFKVEPGWAETLDSSIRTDVSIRSKLKDYLRSFDSHHIAFYLKVCLQGACLENNAVDEESLRCFLDVASLSSSECIGRLVQSGSDLLGLVKSNIKEIRTLAARVAGIIWSHPSNPDDSVENWCKTLEATLADAKSAIGQELNAAEGSLLALGHLLSRLVYYDRSLPKLNFPLSLLVDRDVPATLSDIAMDTFTQLWLSKVAIPADEGSASVNNIIQILAEKAKKGNERAIRSLGALAAGLDASEDVAFDSIESEHLSRGSLGSILESLFKLHEIKGVEIQFTVGDALSAAVARWDSDYVKLTLDVDSHFAQFQSPARHGLVKSTLSKLFKDCKTTKPSLLKASGIWLFCLVQYCSHLGEAQSRLREAQASFMRLLAARDELVQETASRGLSLVYERGDADLRSTLVRDLVLTFTGTAPQLKVEEDTELFEPGALPTGEGSSVTSYKDIVNLANEVGDQSLVYKFMSLAANATTWSTRSAFGRFGLSNILSDSDVDPKLYPKLFRYRFDPNTNVQRSMDGIWKALVKDSNEVLNTHFNAILEDLLASILGREWRMREASCAAIADLLQGRPFSQYEAQYGEVWTTALKVLDDVKGSVREAALKLCITLSNGLVRQLEESNSNTAARAMMKEALPFLLSDKGMESSVKEVKAFATMTIMTIAKKGGEALRPFITLMVPQLLGLLSTIEPEQINYLYQRVGENSRDEIDKIRSQLVSQSPISEAIENCLRFVNGEIMLELAPQLEAAIKNAIGMPTKIGCSRVLITLFTRHANDIKSVSTRLLRLMEKQTLDQNDEVSQAYARAAAYIIRVVPDQTKEQFCKTFIKMYLDSEEDSARQKVGDVILAIAKISPDHFTAQETLLLPFAYLASKDTNEYSSKVFSEVWDQHAGSSRTVVKYVDEIVKLVEGCLESTRWALRHTAAFAIAAMVTDVAKASETTGEISAGNLKVLWPVYDQALALKTFAGKEKLLEPYPDFVNKSRLLWASDGKAAAQMKKVAIREAKRNNDEYRPHAFRCLWRFAKVREDLNMLQEIAEIVTPHLDDFKDDDKMDVDSKDDKRGKDLTGTTAKNGFEAIARGCSRSLLRTDAVPMMLELVELMMPYFSSAKFASIRREVWYESIKDLLSEALEEGKPSTQEGAACQKSWSAAVQTMDLDATEAGTETQRLARVKALDKMLDARKHGIFGATEVRLESLENLVRAALREERALEVQRAWQAVLERF